MSSASDFAKFRESICAPFLESLPVAENIPNLHNYLFFPSFSSSFSVSPVVHT